MQLIWNKKVRLSFVKPLYHIKSKSHATPPLSCVNLIACKQMKTSSSFTARQPMQISGKGVTSGFFVTGDGVYDTWEQFIAGVHKAGNIFKA